MSTQVIKVWWDGEKLMAEPIPESEIYKPQEPGAWRERWYGSGPERGWWVVCGRDHIAHLGPSEFAEEAASKIVDAHNRTLPQAREPRVMQPIIKDHHGVLRFKKNGLVDALYEHGVKTGLGLNELHRMDFTNEDRQQFAQLIGYSVSGYGSLSYVTDEAYDAAVQAANSVKDDK